MIVVLKQTCTEEDFNRVIKKIGDLGLAIHVSKGKERTLKPQRFGKLMKDLRNIANAIGRSL